MRLGKWTVPQLVQTCSLSPSKHGNILMSDISPSGMMYMGMNGRILNPKIWSVFVLLHPVSFLGQLIKRYLTRLTSLFRTVHSLCPVAILRSYWLFLTPSLFGFAVVNNLGLVLGDQMENHTIRAKSRLSQRYSNLIFCFELLIFKLSFWVCPLELTLSQKYPDLILPQFFSISTKEKNCNKS